MKNVVRQTFLISSLFAIVATGAALVAPSAIAAPTDSAVTTTTEATPTTVAAPTTEATPTTTDATPTTSAVTTATPTTSAPALAVTAATACTDIDVVVARGTTEPGTLGIIAGDPFYSSLKKAAPGKTMSAYPVNYPASLALDSAEKGNVDLVNHVTAQAAACPAQKFVLMGYSQGANVVGNSVGISSDGAVVGAKIKAQLDAATGSKVAAIVLFGYPNGKRHITITGPYAARTDDICAKNDIICDPAGLDISAHMSYGFSGLAVKAAAFAAPLL